MALSREVKTGLLAVFAIATLILGYNYLKGTNLLKRTQTFYVVYDNVEGISDASFVTINGLKVGKVQEIQLNQKTGKLVVALSVESNYKIPKGSTAKPYGGLLVGGKNIAITPDYSQTEMAKSGETLQGIQDGGMMDIVSNELEPLKLKIENAVVSADSLIHALNTVLDTNSREDIKKSLANFNAITTSFKKTSVELEQLLSGNRGKLDNTFTNLENVSQNFSKLSDSLAQIEVNRLMQDLETTIANLKDATSKLNNSEGSIGKLLNDEKLYDNLEGASRQLEQLLQDLKLNPKRYVHFSLFGKRAGEYNSPENPDQ
ncbi:MAG TPA: MlaD family protein [Flavobacteriaceae bacterium]|nr:MlaD family protein [Flavobacteriaceae bacterium]